MGVHSGMPKISIYVPDDLYAELRRQNLPISTLAQDAFRDALDSRHNREWIARARQRPARSSSAVGTAEIIAAVRDEFGA